ncbi:MAG TPA: glycosyltransferase [Bryobacteraceae bacterium]|nr:glycosyltransferase [Bryobacteraceae bacterium]
MNPRRYRISILGLSITSSWGNGHATTYRGLMRELTARGHDVLFLERDEPWYAANRDMPNPPWGRTLMYSSLGELHDRFGYFVRESDVVIVGSYVPEGAAVGDWVLRTARGLKAFYDIDTPVTLARLERGDNPYITPAQVEQYDLYLSFTGGPILQRIEGEYGSPMARVLYCSTDPNLYHPEKRDREWEMGYIGTYSPDRQPALDALMLEPARRCGDGRFVVAGPLYPDGVTWPANVERVTHLPPPEHRRFYNSQRFTLNITRADMIRAGHSPSVRLFEAAACGTPIISDCWEGLDSILRIGKEVLVAQSAEDTLRYLRGMSEEERMVIGERARLRVVSAHTAAHRAVELEGHIAEALNSTAKRTAA